MIFIEYCYSYKFIGYDYNKRISLAENDINKFYLEDEWSTEGGLYARIILYPSFVCIVFVEV